MRRSVFLVLGALCCTSSFGQGMLGNIDRDVLNGLLLFGRPDASLVVTRTVPAEIAGISMPAQLSFIGSAERNMGQGVSAIAAYKTSLAEEVAIQRIVDTLVARGWRVQPQVMGAMNRVFVDLGRSSSRVVCRDGKPLAVSAGTIDGVTYMLVTANRGNTSSCDSRATQFMVSRSDYEAHLPRLELPRGRSGELARSSGGGSGGGMNGSAQNFRIDFTLDESVDNISTALARQMTEQGWTRDAAWNGATSAGSTWSKRADAGTLLHGSLQVMDAGEARFRALLHIVKVN